MLSKFNLYELFRILLPGSYYTIMVLVYSRICLNDITEKYGWPIIVILAFVFSLISGSVIYSLDICRIFKNRIRRMPSNLMSERYPGLYPPEEERLNEHKYYEWYENCNKNSRKKTELQSGLYHLSVNFAYTSLIVVVAGFFVKPYHKNEYIVYFNWAIFVLSSFSAFVVVFCRLQFQWERNYWEFEEEVIKKRHKPKRTIISLNKTYPRKFVKIY
jgi:hypothetical protein